MSVMSQALLLAIVIVVPRDDVLRRDLVHERP